MNARQTATLEQLQERFDEDVHFIDDTAIPDETIVYASNFLPGAKIAMFTLSNRGIDMEEGDFFAWNEIRDVHVARVSYATEDIYLGGETRSAGGENFFRFRYEDYGLVDIKMSSLAIDAWKLDLLLYTYQGRYNKMT